MANNDRDDIHLSPQAFWALALAVLSSFGYTTMSTRQDSVRPDPWTGADGRATNMRLDQLEKRMEGLEKRIDAIRLDLNHALEQHAGE